MRQIHSEVLERPEPLDMDKSFNDQGYDSLDKMEITMRCEKEFGVSVDDRIMGMIETPHDVVEIILEALG